MPLPDGHPNPDDTVACPAPGCTVGKPRRFMECLEWAAVYVCSAACRAAYRAAGQPAPDDRLDP